MYLKTLCLFLNLYFGLTSQTENKNETNTHPMNPSNGFKFGFIQPTSQRLKCLLDEECKKVSLKSFEPVFTLPLKEEFTVDKWVNITNNKLCGEFVKTDLDTKRIFNTTVINLRAISNQKRNLKFIRMLSWDNVNEISNTSFYSIMTFNKQPMELIDDREDFIEDLSDDIHTSNMTEEEKKNKIKKYIRKEGTVDVAKEYGADFLYQYCPSFLSFQKLAQLIVVITVNELETSNEYFIDCLTP